MSDVLAGLASVLLDGPILALLLLVVLIMAFLGGYGCGRRAAFREVDEGRAAVLSACERAAAGRVAVPGQRSESD